MTEPAAFEPVARAGLDTLLRHNPSLATVSGDHRYDDRLERLDPEALAEERADLAGALDALAALDPGGLSADDAVDREVLRVALESRAFALDELRPLAHDPLEANPGTAVYTLLARDFAPLGDRLRAAASRLRAVPANLAAARAALGVAPRVHLETAAGQFIGTRALLVDELAATLGEAPALRAEVEPARAAAIEAVDEHLAWLRARLAATDGSADGDPRLGAERFSRKLALSLDLGEHTAADDVLALAEDNLARVEAEIAQVAARLGGTPREVLDRLAAEGGVEDSTVVALCREALATTTAFVAERRLMTVHDDPVEVIVMPEIHRGVAVAYCSPPGPLETAPLPTYFAVAPTPADWSAERARSFYREYNAHMLQELTVHEAAPGHVLQLAHSRRYRGSTPVRACLWNGAFVEGWAVYAEELMADRGYPGVGGPDGNAALRMQQLKMQLRMTINAILDIRVHTRGMTEAEALALMVGRGHQEEGEAVGKWRRALLTSGQLSTYFVGYAAVSRLAAHLRAASPGWDDLQVHDALLAHGSPAPRHVRTLLGL
ncbi:DUF885 domain-containing protein [Motilibacter aurantiacus]|uniref:DUF885 domain-containing protein n=1 Tax=Motilibacter aurantiacus TaxID=2714955 RepID=UPI00140E8C23|nr:DUF885 domain-containing protein [Motilibacter aurantiacus]NHC45850.1 DUF885 domain-containing protein [Motilibacter aurantiacus]